MVTGLGNDIVRISRIQSIVRGKESILNRFATRVLHPVHELPKLSKNTEEATRLLSSTWAAKEALYKSLTPELQKKCVFREWYRAIDSNGQRVVKSDKFPDERCLLSVSHDGEYTSAVVIRQ